MTQPPDATNDNEVLTFVTLATAAARVMQLLDEKPDKDGDPHRQRKDGNEDGDGDQRDQINAGLCKARA